MNWPQIFFGCFVVGFVLSTLSFALTAVDVHFHIHLPFVHHLHLPSTHAPHAAHGAHAGHGASPINFATMMAFLAWFGGTGYLLTSQFGWLTIPALMVSIAIGTTGAGIVFWIMARVLWSPNENMMSADYHMIGVLGRLSHPIRDNGFGELIYSQNGARHSCGARSADGRSIEKGIEVVVTGYERGVAYVQPWDELSGRQS